MISLKIRQIHL